jgi:hypothetical protein
MNYELRWQPALAFCVCVAVWKKNILVFVRFL